MTNRHHPLRKHLLTDKLQYRLLAFNLSYFLVILLISAASLFLPVAIDLEFAADSSLAKQEAATEFLALHSRAWPSLALAFILLGIHSLFVSHRIAGPLQRFRAAMRAVGEGNLTVQVALRTNDYLGTEAETLNAMAANLQRRVGAMQEHRGALGRLFEEVKRTAERSPAAEFRTALDGLGAEIEQLRKCLDQFTTTPTDRGKDGHRGGACDQSHR